MERFYSDRVTTFYVSPSVDDELVVHEVTLEPVEREHESVDFSTWAFCERERAAQRIALALNVLNEIEAWREGDEQERDSLSFLGDVARMIDEG